MLALRHREPLHSSSVIEDNRGLDGALVLDGLESLAKLLELERLVDDTLGLDLARVKVVNGGGCASVSMTGLECLLGQQVQSSSKIDTYGTCRSRKRSRES